MGTRTRRVRRHRRSGLRRRSGRTDEHALTPRPRSPLGRAFRAASRTAPGSWRRGTPRAGPLWLPRGAARSRSEGPALTGSTVSLPRPGSRQSRNPASRCRQKVIRWHLWRSLRHQPAWLPDAPAVPCVHAGDVSAALLVVRNPAPPTANTAAPSRPRPIWVSVFRFNMGFSSSVELHERRRPSSPASQRPPRPPLTMTTNQVLARDTAVRRSRPYPARASRRWGRQMPRAGRRCRRWIVNVETLNNDTHTTCGTVATRPGYLRSSIPSPVSPLPPETGRRGASPAARGAPQPVPHPIGSTSRRDLHP